MSDQVMVFESESEARAFTALQLKTVAELLRDEVPLGVRRGMDFAEYRAVEALSASGAKKLLRSPAHYMLERNEPSAPTESMTFGSAVHCGILEPDRFDALYVRGIVADGRTKEGKAAKEAFAASSGGRTVLKPDDFDRAKRCMEAVRAHPAARALLDATTDRELSAFWQDGKYKVPCKCRFDALTLDGVLDIKTTADASPDAFARSIATYQYHVQAAHYFSGAEHAIGHTPSFYVLIAAESEPPYGVAVYELPSNAILAGGHLMERALERYAAALASGRWDSYPETIEAIQLPRWALRFDY